MTVSIVGKDRFSPEARKAQDSAQGFGATLGKVGEIASGFLAANVIQAGIGRLTGAISDSIAGWKEQIEVSAQTKAVIESTGGAAGLTAKQIEDMAGSLKNNSRFADDAIQSGENLLLTFTSIGKDVFPDATQTMLDMSQALGQDLSASAVQLGKALNDPVQGVTALRRVGVSFTDSQLDQIKAMQESGDLMGAQKLILGELNKEFGGSAKAASDAAGAEETYADKLDDLQDTIGQKLLPLQLKWKELQAAVFTFLLDKGLPAFERLGKFAATAGDEIRDRLLGPLGTLRDIAGEVRHFFEVGFGGGEAGGELGALQKTAYDFGKMLHDNFLPALGDARDKVSEFIHFFTLGFDGGKIGGDLGAVQELAFKLGESFRDARDKIADALKTVGDKIGEFLGDNKREVFEAIGLALAYMGSAVVVGGLIALASALTAAAVGAALTLAPFILIPAAIGLIAFGIIELIKHWDDITARFPILGDAADAVQTQLGKFVDWVQDTLIPAVMNIGDTIADTFRAIEGFTSEHWNQIQNIIEGVLKAVLAIVTNVLDELVVIFKSAFEILHGVIMVFHGLFTGDWQEMWDGIKLILDGAVDLITGTIGNMKDTLLGIGTVLLDGLVATFKALGSAIIEELSHLKDAVVGVVTDIGDWMLDHWQGIVTGVLAVLFPPGAGLFLIITHFSEIKDQVGAILISMKDMAVGLASDLVSAVVGALGNAANGMYDIGTAIMNGLENGMRDAFYFIANFVGLLGDRIQWGITGYPWGLLYGIGQAIMEGLLNGIVAGWNAVAGFLGSTAQKIKDLKGPIDKDRTLLIPEGNAIMQGLNEGIQRGFSGRVAPTLSAITNEGIPSFAPTGGGGGGVGNVYHINVQSLDPRSAADLVLQALVQLERRGGVTPGVTRALA